MSEEVTTFPLAKNAYAAFDAISLRNLIIERLNKSNLFTDQNYVGSNLAAIIDIISYSYHTLLFYLNKTSTESTFTEAQLYENISRIVKLLDYKPTGYQTSTLSFEVSAFSKFPTNGSFNGTTDLIVGQPYTIPRYSYLMIGGVQFSFNEDITFNTTDEGVIRMEDISNRKLLYQGLYRENPIHTALGDPSETITIVNSTGLVDHFNLDIYVFEKTTNTWHQYKNVPSLYLERPFARVFEKRLNSNGLYDIMFGDGINGKQLNRGDLVAVYYLESLGENGVIGPNVLKIATKTVFSTTTFDNVLSDLNVTGIDYLTNATFANLLFDNVVGSTIPRSLETVESIKKNAPANFKSQYRLVTKEDFENFIKINFSNIILDTKIFSNSDYVTKYLKYFNDISIQPAQFNQILLNQILYSDSCNFNNVYVCAVPSVAPESTLKYLLPAQKELISSTINPLKTMTSEIVFMDPVYKAVSIGIKTNNDFNVVDRNLCKLIVNRTLGNRRSSKSIINDIQTTFNNNFNPQKARIGAKLEFSNLLSQLLAIDGIESFKTKRVDTEETYDGLCLWVWNPNYPELDKQAVVNDVNMEEFTFLYYTDLLNLASQIEVTENLSFT